MKRETFLSAVLSAALLPPAPPGHRALSPLKTRAELTFSGSRMAVAAVLPPPINALPNALTNNYDVAVFVTTVTNQYLFPCECDGDVDVATTNGCFCFTYVVSQVTNRYDSIDVPRGWTILGSTNLTYWTNDDNSQRVYSDNVLILNGRQFPAMFLKPEPPK